jgi:hypothetical protein
MIADTYGTCVVTFRTFPPRFVCRMHGNVGRVSVRCVQRDLLPAAAVCGVRMGTRGRDEVLKRMGVAWRQTLAARAVPISMG